MKKVMIFVICSIMVYWFSSLPIILGYGVDVVWIPEASEWQKFKFNFIEGITNDYLPKLIWSLFYGLITTAIIIYVNKKTQNKPGTTN